MPQDYLTFSLPEVLIADDDDGIRETVRFILEEAGYPVCEASDGVEALTILCRSTRPHIVLLDLMMPRLDGIAVVRAVLSDPAVARRDRFILVSANLPTYAPALRSLLAETDADIMAKPFDIDGLLDTIGRAAHALETDIVGSLGAAVEQQTSLT